MSLHRDSTINIINLKVGHILQVKFPMSSVFSANKGIFMFFEGDESRFCLMLHELFNYDPEKGVLVWAVKRKGTNGVGAVAGYVNKLKDSRRFVMINGKLYPHARLVFLYNYGSIGGLVVDHIDNDPTNDKIENLRAVTISQNNTNKLSKLVYDNPSGSFSVKLRIQGKFKHIGTFKCQRRATDIAKLSHAIVNAEYSPYHWEMLASNSNDTLMGAIQ